MRKTAEQVRNDVCGSKIRHATHDDAKRHANELNALQESNPFSIYRCPFTEPHHRHWHVGHIPSMFSLEAIARVIRGLDPNPPEPHDEPIHA